ncbi:MAG: PEP-CTERM system TPR-repeat protein PrsT [Pseudomonadales bacterium]
MYPIKVSFLAFALLLPSLGGCDSTTPQEHVARAEQNLATNDLRTAVIELKNALQKQPDLASARLLLGEAHARLGDYPSALKEFERALDLGIDDQRLKVDLLAAKVRVGRYQEVIGELADAGALPKPLAVVLADAYLAGGDAGRARVLYQQAPQLAGANLGLARIAWSEGDAERAGHYFDQAVTLDENSVDAWLAKAEFELSQHTLDAAAQSFERASALPAGDLSGALGLARVSLLQGDLTAAGERIRNVLKRAPRLPVAQYLDGLIRFQQGDLDGAEAAIRNVQSVMPDHAPSLYLMGAIKYREGQLAQAEDNLQRFLARDKRNESAAKVLASVRLEQGDFEGVADVLEPLVAVTADPQLLAIYGSAQLRLGHTDVATSALERAVALAPDMAPFRNQLALSLLAAGDQGRAEAELETAIAVDESQFQSEYLMALLRIRERDWAGAEAAVASLLAKEPNSAVGLNLRGAVALGRQDAEAAQRDFRAALAADPTFLPAVQNLATLAERNGDSAGAARLYQDLLDNDPDNEGALLSLADLMLRERKSDAAVRYLETAAGANGQSVRARLGLARLYLASNRVDDATRVLEEALAVAPDLPDLNLLKAETLLRSGDTAAAQAIATELQSALGRREANGPLYLALGSLQARVGQRTLARSNLNRALELSDGSSVPALRALTRLDLGERNVGAAQSRLDALRKLGDSGPEFSLLAADVQLAGGDRAGAAAAYRELASEGVRDGVMRSAAMALGSGDADAAATVLQRWLEDHPQDAGADLLLADAFLRQDDKAAALQRYERLAASGNPVVLNNLAWLYMERGDDRAVATARQAVAAAPDSPAVLDTLGWILVQQNSTEEGLQVLTRSVQLGPDNPSVRYHLAVAQRAAGQHDAARDNLRQALAAGAFPESEAAQQLLDALSAG